MIRTTIAYQDALIRKGKFHGKLNFTLRDGMQFTVDNDSIMNGGLSIDEATSDSGGFDVGSAIMGTCSITLDNYDDFFTNLDFQDAKVIVQVGNELLNGNIEWSQKGVFIVDEPKIIMSTVVLDCVDLFYKLDIPFSSVNLTIPTSFGAIVRGISTACGIPLATSTFNNHAMTISTIGDTKSMTCRDVLSHVAQACGLFAKMNRFGQLEMKWYDVSAFQGEDDVYGGYFDSASPYASGDNIDGGDFTFTDTVHYNGGTFADLDRYHVINDTNSSTVGINDIEITGIKLVYDTLVGEESVERVKLLGTIDYAITIEKNIFVVNDTIADTIANVIGQQVIGMKFRTASVSVPSNPTIESGDIAYVSDVYGRSVRIYITQVEYGIDGTTNVSCDAETKTDNNRTSNTATSKMEQVTRQLIAYERQAREIAIDNITDLMESSSGMYPSEEVLPDGSKIMYLHDKPTKAESTIVWKLVAEGLSISTDGGTTYPTNLTSDGNAILNKIYAIGIVADYIRVENELNVNDNFVVNKDGVLTTKQGIIGNFNFNNEGFTSETMQLVDNINDPLIWLKSKDKVHHANYQGSLTYLRNSKNGTRRTILLDARDSSDGGTHGIHLTTEEISDNDELQGRVVDTFELTHNGLSIDNADGDYFFSLRIGSKTITFMPDGIFFTDESNNSIAISGGSIIMATPTGSVNMNEDGIEISHPSGVFLNGIEAGSLGGSGGNNTEITNLAQKVVSLENQIIEIRQAIGMP